MDPASQVGIRAESAHPAIEDYHEFLAANPVGKLTVVTIGPAELTTPA